MTPERALLARMVERLDVASMPEAHRTGDANRPEDTLVRVARAVEAADHWAWLIAELATLETET